MATWEFAASRARFGQGYECVHVSQWVSVCLA